MKPSLVESKTTGFKPMTLTIEIETEHDLVDLYHRFNFNYHPTYEGDYMFHKNPKGKAAVWTALDKAVKEAGIDPNRWTEGGE